MRMWSAAATNPLRCQASFLAEQPQDSLAADTDAVLATEPGADLAVALAGER
jgi:hypothetical protein